MGDEEKEEERRGEGQGKDLSSSGDHRQSLHECVQGRSNGN